MVQINRDVDLPLHYEASYLRFSLKAAGWLIAMLALPGGIAAFVRAESFAGEAVSALLVVVGVTLVVLLIRCRRYEVTVGKRMIELRLGPFRRTLPAGCVEEAVGRPASSWRRFYAPSELELATSVETRPFVVPTRDPNELRAALVDGATRIQ
jgi:hypothetical protein